MTFKTITNQELPVIKCFLINHRNNDSSVGTSTSNPMASESPEDLECALRPESAGAVYEAATVEVDMSVSITLRVLVTTPGNISCLWVFKHSSLNCQPHFDLQNRGVVSMVILKMTENQAGEYLLFIQAEATNYTVLFTVSIRNTLLYTLRRPYFRKLENQDALVCISEGTPEPTVEWVFCESQGDSCKGESSAVVTKEESVLHELFGTDIRCCARNELGRECTKLFTIDLNQTPQTTPPQLFLKVGEPLWIRCKAVHVNHGFGLTWELENKALEKGSYFEMSTYSTNRTMIRILFAFVSSVGRNDTGYYTCSSSEHPSKSALVTILEKGFINASKSNEDYEIDQYEEFCFSVRFKAYPQIRCSWTFSRKSFPCEQSGLDDGYSVSKFCNHKHQPGQYIFHAENDDAQFTKTFTLNIRRKPQVLAEASASQASCSSDGYPLPSWTWKKCSDKSPNCTEEITEGVWNKKANRKVFGQWVSSSTLNMSEAVKGLLVKCCAYNSLGTSCETILLNSPGPFPFIQDNISFYATIGLCLPFIAVLTMLICHKYKKKYPNHGPSSCKRQISLCLPSAPRAVSISSPVANWRIPVASGYCMPGSREVQIHQDSDPASGFNGNSFQSEDEIEYENQKRLEEEEDLNVLTFEDLLCFAYQVAKGMEFLEFKSGRASGWSASLMFFSGVNPYPGIPADANFYKLIQSGFKMDQPFYATEEIYFIMQSCWAFDSRKRPSFPNLTSFLGCQLADAEEAMYQNMDGRVSERASVYQNRRPYSREVDAGLPSPQAHVEDS
ncbi:Receptor-type tyrosine-protein kinase FLT3 [Camelus dromedarius]|uniref:receptor protein-tyrosine kinase n=1 Tax=Camelus dromedarius TaxID=9838 RepID=A0A5N4D8P2_CAMDR|nr:Receptor-type tyrosine-protein kinase FLT3 [Camelus dromedarius]